MVIAPTLIERFAADLDRVGADGRAGIAVSGGPDSIALLLLAEAARPGQIEAATVDHCLREGSAGEAALVASLCHQLCVPHTVLSVAWSEHPTAAIQARARDARYDLLARWAIERGLEAVLTAHHADDQAETLLMRLGRGAGVSGLAGVREQRLIGDAGQIRLLRPLLHWHRSELAEVADSAAIEPVDDPSNRDPRFERSRARAFLAGQTWPDARQFAASAEHLAEAEEALRFAADTLFASRVTVEGDAALIDPSGLPRELQRRLLLAVFSRHSDRAPGGPDLDRAIATLNGGGRCTLGSLMLTGGQRWRCEPVPPRRS